MSSNHSTSEKRGTLAVLFYLCECAVVALRDGRTERAAEFLEEASHEQVKAADQSRALHEAAERAEAAAVAARLEAEQFDRGVHRAGRRIEKLALYGWRRELATPRHSDVRALGGPLGGLIPLALAALVFLAGCSADAGAADMPAVHFPVSTYVAGVAGAPELGALQGALAAGNSACVPRGAEANTAPTPLFWAHYEPAPADTCGALPVRLGGPPGTAELVQRTGCLPELVLGAGVDVDAIVGELSVFTIDHPELVCE